MEASIHIPYLRIQHMQMQAPNFTSPKSQKPHFAQFVEKTNTTINHSFLQKQFLHKTCSLRQLSSRKFAIFVYLILFTSLIIGVVRISYPTINGYARMIAFCPINSAAGKNILHKSLSAQALISNSYCRLASHRPIYTKMSLPSQSFISVQTFHGRSFWSGFSKQNARLNSTTVESLVFCRGTRKRNIKCSIRRSWSEGYASKGLIFSLLVCSASSVPLQAEALNKEHEEGFSHGKKVYTNYSVTGVPGDGRCLFRSVAHGACLRSGKPAPDGNLQKELADELRAKVADEFVQRREETEWFIEGDFDSYVSQIRKPHVWGGEPELLMASHVLQMPITVYMHDKDSGGLISIAEYGEEYGKENPVRVLYHGYGHYEALQIPGKITGKSRL